MNCWLVKTEPIKYSWSDFVRLGIDKWDGIRNYQARNNLKEMKVGELVLFYHSNDGKEVVGIAAVVREFYQDPTTNDERWVCVDLAPVQKLENPVSLVAIKTDNRLQNCGLITQPRLSVLKLTLNEFDIIISKSNE